MWLIRNQNTDFISAMLFTLLIFAAYILNVVEFGAQVYSDSGILQFIIYTCPIVFWVASLVLFFQLTKILFRIYYYFTVIHPYLDRVECAKTFVITGASSGIGFETAALLYSKGATVIMLVRNANKAKEAMRKIKLRYQDIPHQRRSRNGRLYSIYLDLTDESSIHLAAHHILNTFDRVDVLVNNAGIGSQRTITRVGHKRTELVMQSNFFGHVLLTLLLLPSLQESSGRVINVSSVVYNYCDLPIDDLNFKQRKYNGFTAYSNSKCSLIMMNRYLSTAIPPNRATFYSVDPGIVATPIGDHFVEHAVGHRVASLIQPLARAVYSVIGKTTTEGCQTILHLSTKELAPEENGEFFQNCRVSQRQSDFINDKEMCKKLWNAVVLEIYPGQTDFHCHFDYPYFNRLTYARNVKTVCYEADSNDDTLSICSSDVTLPDSASCSGQPCFEKWSDGESLASSLFPDPRDEADWDAIDVSKASLLVHQGSYEPPVEFSDEELEQRNYLKKLWVSDPILFSEESDNNFYLKSPESSFHSSSDSSEEQASIDHGNDYDECGLRSKSASDQDLTRLSDNSKEDLSDDDSILYLFPRSLTFDDGSVADFSIERCNSAYQATSYLTDEALFAGLMRFKSGKFDNKRGSEDDVCDNKEVKIKKIQSDIMRTRKNAEHPEECSDPFADFNVDEYTYGRYVNPDWLKLSEQHELSSRFNNVEFTTPETDPEFPDISVSSSGRSRTTSKLKKRWDSMKKLFQRSSK